MPSTEEAIQKTVLSLEAGELAKWVRRALFTAGIVALSGFYLFAWFPGISTPQAMDQAQIGRELVRGHGFATKFIRPLAVGELQRNGRNLSADLPRDTYNAPIPCLLDAAALYYPLSEGWQMTRNDFVYAGDRAIAMAQVICFLGSLVMLYLLAAELFDHRLARIACGLVLVCNMMWQYAVSGLPQMWLLLLLNSTLYLLARAMRASYLKGPVYRWLAGAGLGFGLLALSHALTLWLFVPALIFSALYFRPRPWPAAVMLAVFLAVYTPWLARNARVCGDYRGMAIYSILDGADQSEATQMRQAEPDEQRTLLGDIGFIKGNLLAQMGRLIEYLGWSLAAPVVFVSLLHSFKRPVTAAFRWLVLLMWAGAVLGMAIFGMKEEQGGLGANQLHVLFVPVFVCYGMAYILVQWDRRIGLGFLLPQWQERRGSHVILRNSVVVLIFLLSGFPMLAFFLSVHRRIPWPPYVPPYISVIRDWTRPNEIVGSDMPWAVAWYADRRSIWLPMQPSDLLKLSDFATLGGPVPALYFTPVSGTENTLGSLVTGEWKGWTGYIVRTVNVDEIPYHWRTQMGTPDCVFYADADRRGPEDLGGAAKPAGPAK